ncbi:hypothetical protein RJ44_15065 [Alteromonas macleodii]|uniref:S8 family peptidase n=1 Tax=Alteromonas macleodii TaxID=28108 RepID=UPI0005808B6B|nr:S8 family serine peptidase [Alteromonas macleodii]KHT57741.1 hypothetical protein RJ44_15065 [Alteromonas macleodii]
MFKGYLIVLATAMFSMQISANSGAEPQGNASEPLFYEVENKQYLSEKNEFNTQLAELDSIEITPYWIHQTGLDQLPQPSFKRLKVCIIDSGVDSNHEDLSEASIGGYWSSYGGNWSEDSIGHGTHISGIISASNNGTGIRGAIDNGNIDIHVQKLVRSSRGSDSIISDANLIESIEICAGAGANIINLSLSSSSYSNSLRDVIDRLTYQNGIIFVAAAGNHGTASGKDFPVFPAAYRNVVGVGAININDQLADFSPSYRGITVVAPGLDILSTVPYINNKVSSIYYESDDGYFEFDYSQIDKGLNYPTKLPSQESCYHTLSAGALSEQITESKLSIDSINELDNASFECQAEGGSVLVLSYDYLETVENPVFDTYSTWLTSLNYDAQIPTLLMPGLNSEEVSFFKEGNVSISSEQQRYAAVTGTSQSAAIVTAGIAKLWSNFPDASAKQILNAINFSATPLNGIYPENAVGNGSVHFGRAYSYMLEYDDVHAEPMCPEAWYDNKAYNASEKATFQGNIYKANYWTKNQFPDTNSEEYGPWTKIAKCDNPPKEAYDYVQEQSDPYYELNETEGSEIEVIEVSYKCKSYSFSCGGGGGGFGGFGGVSFGSGYSGGGYSGTGGGGGSSSSSDSDSSQEETEKKKQEEYDDIKKRSENTPKQKPGESKEAYNKRLSEYYKKLASDYKKWDDKYNKGRHTQKIQDLLNRANKYEKAYQNAVRHRQVTEQYKNGQKPKPPLCKAKTAGVIRLIQTLGCLIP